MQCRLSRANVNEDGCMTSVFGWVATGAEQRRRMTEIVDQFRDPTTIDDLGLGGIRDALAGTLFPGTSTLHTPTPRSGHSSSQARPRARRASTSTRTAMLSCIGIFRPILSDLEQREGRVHRFKGHAVRRSIYRPRVGSRCCGRGR